MRSLALVLVLLAGCAKSGTAVVVSRLPAGAVVPYVSAGGAVSYIDEEARAFRMIRWSDGTLSESRTIVSDPAMLINRADFPSIDASGDDVVAAWSTRREHGSVVHVARSSDGGLTWGPARTPHPNLVSQFGFASLAGDDLVYLDGRRLQGGMEGSGEMELRAGDGTPLDTRVCDCCQTAIAQSAEGPVVAYRDRSADEVRDVAIVRRVRGRWTKPQALGAEGWRIPGCPVNGPQLDADGSRVVAVWFTAANDDPRAYVAFSGDAGASFGKPVRVDSGPVTGRADTALFPDGSAAVSWVVQKGEKSYLRVRRIHPDGTLGTPVDLGESEGFPRIAVWDENVAVVWSHPTGAQLAIIERL